MGTRNHIIDELLCSNFIFLGKEERHNIIKYIKPPPKTVIIKALVFML